LQDKSFTKEACKPPRRLNGWPWNSSPTTPKRPLNEKVTIYGDILPAKVTAFAQRQAVKSIPFKNIRDFIKVFLETTAPMTLPEDELCSEFFCRLRGDYAKEVESYLSTAERPDLLECTKVVEKLLPSATAPQERPQAIPRCCFFFFKPCGRSWLKSLLAEDWEGDLGW